MPVFHVQISSQINHEYVVNAKTREQAETFAFAAAAASTDTVATKNVIRVRTDSSESCHVVDGEKRDWTEALKRKKGA